MVTKAKKPTESAKTKSRISVGKLKLNKETIKDLSRQKEKGLKGGWPTQTGQMDGQCTGRHSTCI